MYLYGIYYLPRTAPNRFFSLRTFVWNKMQFFPVHRIHVNLTWTRRKKRSGFIDNLTVKIKRETDLSDSWRSNISAIFSDKSDKSVSFSSRRIHVNLFSGHRRYFLFPNPGNGVALIGNSGFPIISCKDDKKWKNTEKTA